MSLGGACRACTIPCRSRQLAVDARRRGRGASGNTGPAMALRVARQRQESDCVGAVTNPHYIGIARDGGQHNVRRGAGDFDTFRHHLSEYTVTEPANGCAPITTDLTGKVALSTAASARSHEGSECAGPCDWRVIVNSRPGDPIPMAADDTLPPPTIPAAMPQQGRWQRLETGRRGVDRRHGSAEFASDNADILATSRRKAPRHSRIRSNPR